MKTLLKRVWTEPAVATGLLTSAILAVIAAVEGDWDTATIIGIVAPFASSLGIRQFVTPTRSE